MHNYGELLLAILYQILFIIMCFRHVYPRMPFSCVWSGCAAHIKRDGMDLINAIADDSSALCGQPFGALEKCTDNNNLFAQVG